MYKNIFYNRDTKQIHLWDDEAGHKILSTSKYNYGFIKSDTPTEWKNLRGEYVQKVKNKWDYKPEELYESDVKTEYRVLLDEYLNKTRIPNNLGILFFDIEVAKTEKGYSTVDNPIGKITSICLKNSLSDKGYVIILDEEDHLRNDSIQHEKYEVFSVPTEEDLLLYFYKIYENSSPDILTGWNINFFDIPYLYNRTSIVLGGDFSKKLSPIGIVTKSYHKGKPKFNIAGVSILDYIELYKNFSINENPSYALDYICKKELGFGKIKYDGSLHNLYLTDPKKFVEYNINDVELVIKLEKKLQYILLAINTCIDGYVDFESIYYSSSYIDGSGLAYLRNKNIVVDNKTTHSGETFKGAFVKEPKSGLHFWVYDLDLTSLYPSIIRSLNISPETLVGKVFGWSSSDFLGDNSFKSYNIEFISGEKTSFLQDDLINYLKTNNYSIASNGSFYRNDFRGFIPSILDTWFKLRSISKDNMHKYKKLKDEVNTLKYFIEQYTQKIKLNTFYGVLGLPGYRFYNLWNAEAVTLTGQDIIQSSMLLSNQYYYDIIGEDKDYVIASDTDSEFLSIVPILEKLYPDFKTWNEDKVVDVSLKEIKKIQEYINTFYDYYAINFLNVTSSHFFKMKQELFAKSAIWVGVKKKYGLYVINEEGVSVNYLKAVGLDNVRSDFPKLLRVLLDDILRLILKDLKNKEEVTSYIKDWYRDIHLNIDKEKILGLMFPTSVQEISKYETGQLFVRAKGTPIHVNSSLNYNDYLLFNKIEGYSPITDGQKIKWSYLKSNELKLKTIAINEEDFCEEVFNFIIEKYDIDSNIESSLINKLQSYYDTLNWGIVRLDEDKSEEFFSF